MFYDFFYLVICLGGDVVMLGVVCGYCTKNMLLRLYVNMCVSSWEICVVLIAMSVALNSVHRMFW